MFLDAIRNWLQIASSLGSILALAAAAFWFFRTSKAKQRIQFDIDCRIYPLAANPDQKVAEIQLCFENKGFVEHRIYNLTVSVHALDSETDLQTKDRDRRIAVSPAHSRQQPTDSSGRRLLLHSPRHPPGDRPHHSRRCPRLHDSHHGWFPVCRTRSVPTHFAARFPTGTFLTTRKFRTGTDRFSTTELVEPALPPHLGDASRYS